MKITIWDYADWYIGRITGKIRYLLRVVYRDTYIFWEDYLKSRHVGFSIGIYECSIFPFWWSLGMSEYTMHIGPLAVVW